MVLKKNLITSLIIGLTAVMISFIGIALYNANKNSTSPVNSNVSEFVGDSISVRFKYKNDGDYVILTKSITDKDESEIELTKDDVNELMMNALTDDYSTASGWTISEKMTEQQKVEFYNSYNKDQILINFETQIFSLNDNKITTDSNLAYVSAASDNIFTVSGTTTVDSGISSRQEMNYVGENTAYGTYWIKNNTGQYSFSGRYFLMNDIDMGGKSNPWGGGIGTNTNPFKYTFDGQGYAIKNIFINDKTRFGDAIGLFGVISNATIKNLNLDTFKIYLYQSMDTEGSITDNVGILCGKVASGTSAITNISAYANESATANWTGEVASGKDDANCGILVKELYVKESGGLWWKTYSSSPQYVGGLVGTVANSATLNISNVIFRGNISVQVTSAARVAIAGGIVGIIRNVDSGDIYTSEFIDTSTNVKYGTSSSVNQCIFEGEIYITVVKANSSTALGGDAQDGVNNTVNISLIGGICGAMLKPAQFTNCIANLIKYGNVVVVDTYSADIDFLNSEDLSWRTSRISPGLLARYGDTVLKFYSSNDSYTVGGYARVSAPLMSGINLLDGCAPTSTKNGDSADIDLKNFATCETYLNISEEGANCDTSCNWFIDDKVNDGYPIPMTLLRIKDYKFTLTVQGGYISWYYVGLDDNNSPRAEGDTVIYSSTIQASPVYTMPMADYCEDLILGADASSYNDYYYLGEWCLILVEDEDYYYQSNAPYTDETNREITFWLTARKIEYRFPSKGSITINSDISINYTLNLENDNEYQFDYSDGCYVKDIPTGIVIEYQNSHIIGYRADYVILFEFTLTIEQTDGVDMSKFVQCSSWLSTCRQKSSGLLVKETKINFDLHEVGEVTTDENNYEVITPQFEAEEYTLSSIILNSTSDKVIPSDLIGELDYSNASTTTGYFNLKVTINGNSVVLKYDNDTSNLSEIVVVAKDKLFNTDVAYWKYNDINGELIDFPSEGLYIYEISAIQAYLDPIDYSFNVDYNKNGEDTYAQSKSYTYNIASEETSIEDPEFIPEGKTFGGWLLLDCNQENPYEFDGVNYTISSINETDKVLFLQATQDSNIVGQWMFKYSTIFDRSIEGKKYYSITTFIALDTNNNYSYGILPSTHIDDKDKENPLIRSYWGNTYDVNILNDAINTLWYENDLNSEFTYAGVNSQLYTNGLTGTNSILITISASPDSQYAFASSETNDGDGISMFKFSDFTSESYVPKIEGSNNYYYVYAYGYRIIGWQIYFTYDDTIYYLIISNNDDSEENAEWTYTTDQLYSINSIGNLSNTNSNNLAYYADDLDQILIGIITNDIKIKMTPVWEAVSIRPNAIDGSLKIDGPIITYNDKGAESGKEGYYLTDLINKLSNLGQSIAYFTTENGSNIAIAGTWNYYNIGREEFNYQTNTKIYEIPLEYTHYSDNIYKVNLDLNGFENATLNSEQTNYSIYEGESAPQAAVYTFKDFGYIDYLNSGYEYIEEYVDTLVNYISNYDKNVGASQDFYAYTIYSDGRQTYIYLTNNKSIGYLPVYTTGSKILIAWNNYNKNGGSNLDGDIYSYLTAAYDDSIHSGIMNLETTIPANEIWEYSQAYFTDIDVVTLKPYFFRKTFNLDWHILFNGKESDAGYAILNVEDVDSSTVDTEDSVSATYLLVNFIENNQTYHNVYKISGINGFNLSTFTINSYNLQNLSGYLVENFYLYADSNYSFYIYDQSKDTTAVSNNYLYKMLGYRLDGISSTSFGNLNDNGNNRYSYSINADTIESMNFRNGEILDFSAIFTKIIYTTSINLDNEKAGYLTIYLPDGSMMTRVNSSGDINFVLDDQIRVVYTAYIGYEFEVNAVTLTYKNATITLLLDSEIENQEYTFLFNALWLNNNYYSQFNTNYTVPNTATDTENIGKININTKQIEFEAKVKLYNGTEEFAVINLVDETFRWKLDDETLTLSQLFETTGSVGTKNIYGLIYLDNKYAVLSSWAYLPKRPTDNRNYYTTYNFPNYEIPTREYPITSDLLSSMVVTGSGEIVPKENRIIYFAFEVYEQYEITMQAKALDHDTNSTTRTTTASSVTYMYTSTLTLNEGATSDATNKLFESTSKFYAYNGATFALLSSFDNKRYTSVSYEYNGMNIVSGILFNSENINDDKTGIILISYIPRPLEARVEYYIEDNGSVVNVDKSEVNSILRTTLSSTGSLYLDSEVTINIEPVDEREYMKYNISVTVGDVIQEIVPNNYEGSDGLFTGKHIVSDYIDYNAGEVIFNVTLKMKSHDSVEVMFTLTDEEYWTKESSTLTNTRGLQDDVYGNLKLFVDGEEIDSLNSNIIEGQLVEAEVSLNFGYTLRGYRQNIGTIVSLPTTTTRFTLTESFNANENTGDGGYYTIYISKDLYSAVLSIDENSSKNYQIESAGSIKTQNTDKSMISLDNIYIGKTIIFNQVEDLANERLDYYYYINKEGEQVVLDLVDNMLKVDEALLKDIDGNTLQFGVVTVKRYKLEYVVSVGSEFLGEISTSIPVEVNDEIQYYDVGTVINLKINTIEPGKYVISLFGSMVSSGYTIDTDIELDSDKLLDIQIRADSYTVAIDEYIYSNIGDLSGGAVLPDTTVNAIQSSTQYYNEDASLSIAISSSDRILTGFVFNSGDISFELSIKDNEITSVSENAIFLDGVLTVTIDEVEYSYKISITNGRLIIGYTSIDDISIEAYYTELKEISPN